MKELNEEIIPEDSSKSHIQNKDLLYPFAVVLLMLSIFDITGNFAAIGLLAALLLGFLGSTSESMLTLLTLFLNLIAQLGSILIFIVLHQSNRIESEEKEMPHGPYLLIVLLVYSIDFIYIIFVTPLIDMILKQLATFFGISLGELVSTYEGIFPTLDLLENPLYYLLFFGVLVFGAAISEELIFRRTLIPFLERRGFGTFWVLIFSSLLFSLIHTPADLISGSIRYAIVHFFGTFAGGLTLGFIYMRTRDVRWPMLLHGLSNGFAGVAAIALARYEELNEYTLIFVSGFWIMIFTILGIGTTVYSVVQFIRKRKAIDIPVWIRILTDFNLRTKYLNFVIALIIGFILIEGGIPVVLDFLFGFLGEATRERLILENLVGLFYLIPLVIILGYFIYRTATPLETPDWVSEPIISVPKPIHFIPQRPTIAQFCTYCGRPRIQGTQYCVYCGEKYLEFIPTEIPEERW